MLLFAFTAVFFLGYKFAYDKANVHANNQIEEKMEELRNRYGFSQNPDFLLGNIIDIPEVNPNDT